MSAVKATATKGVFAPLPFEKGQVLAGNPEGVCIMLSEAPTHSVGVWRCTPGQFRWTYDGPETIYVLRGRASVKVEGMDKPLQLAPGVVVRIPKGSKAIWTITEDIEKVFCKTL